MKPRLYDPDRDVAPNCPKCGREMTGGAPHGDWPVQWECRWCGTVVIFRKERVK